MLLMIHWCVTMTMTTGLLQAVVLTKKEMTIKITVISGEKTMDNLQYDSFYKFIVSVGIVLIVAPLFCLHYLVSGSYDIIISQEEANNLSQISSDFLSIKIQYIHAIFKYLPIICFVFISIGIIFTLWGSLKWLHIQKTLDKITKLDLEEKELHIQSMSAQEIAEKIIQEDIENHESINTDPQKIHSYAATSSRIRKVFEVEEASYNYLKKKLKKRYNILQNVKVGNYEYDIIATSKYNNIDLLYEIKYWNNPVTKSTLVRFISKIEQHGVAYENTAHRNFRFIILIVYSADIPTETTDYLNNLIKNRNLSFISVEAISENQLFSV